MKKSITIALAALAIGAGSLKAGDYWEQQRRSEEFERRQAEWQAQFDRRNYEMEQERRFQELQDQINRNQHRNRFDYDFDN